MDSEATADLEAQSRRGHAEEHVHLTPRVYVIIWAILNALVVLTLVLGEVPLGRWNFPISFAIAMTKAVLIILFFMHVKYSPGLVKVVACAGFFWFGIMIVLTFSDYVSRGWLEPEVILPAPNPPMVGHGR